MRDLEPLYEESGDPDRLSQRILLLPLAVILRTAKNPA